MILILEFFRKMPLLCLSYDFISHFSILLYLFQASKCVSYSGLLCNTKVFYWSQNKLLHSMQKGSEYTEGQAKASVSSVHHKQCN